MLFLGKDKEDVPLFRISTDSPIIVWQNINKFEKKY